MNSLLYGFGLFETIRVSGGVPEFLHYHIRRMAGSARFFGLEFSEESFMNALAEALADRSPDADWRVRLSLFLEGGRPVYLASAEPLGFVPDAVQLAVSGIRVFSENPLCQHKTTSRLIYYLAQREAESAGYWDGLLLNQRDEVAETGRANIFFLIDNEIFTPPVSSGILPGIMREVLLRRGLASERVLLASDIRRASAAFVTNSLIRAAAVSRIEGFEYEHDAAALQEIREALLSELR